MSWKKQFDEAKKKRFPMEEKSSKKSVRKINENIKAKKRGNFLIVTIDGVEYKAWMWGASAIKKDVLDKLKADGNWLIEVEGENASRGYIANGLLKLSPYYKGDDYLKSKVVKNALIDKVKEYHKKQFDEAKKKRFPMEEKRSKKLNEGKVSYEKWVQMFLELLDDGGFLDWEYAAELYSSLINNRIIEEDDLNYYMGADAMGQDKKPSANDVIFVLLNRLAVYVSEQLFDKYAITLGEVGLEDYEILDGIGIDVNGVASSIYLNRRFVRDIEDSLGREFSDKFSMEFQDMVDI